MTERTSSVNAEGVFEPFRVDEVPWVSFALGAIFGMRHQALDAFGGHQIHVSMEILLPGLQANPPHCPRLEEEQVKACR